MSLVGEQFFRYDAARVLTQTYLPGSKFGYGHIARGRTFGPSGNVGRQGTSQLNIEKHLNAGPYVQQNGMGTFAYKILRASINAIDDNTARLPRGGNVMRVVDFQDDEPYELKGQGNVTGQPDPRTAELYGVAPMDDEMDSALDAPTPKASMMNKPRRSSVDSMHTADSISSYGSSVYGSAYPSPKSVLTTAMPSYQEVPQQPLAGQGQLPIPISPEFVGPSQSVLPSPPPADAVPVNMDIASRRGAIDPMDTALMRTIQGAVSTVGSVVNAWESVKNSVSSYKGKGKKVEDDQRSPLQSPLESPTVETGPYVEAKVKSPKSESPKIQKSGKANKPSPIDTSLETIAPRRRKPTPSSSTTTRTSSRKVSRPSRYSPTSGTSKKVGKNYGGRRGSG